MTTDNKQYKLLKDLPECKEGNIFIQHDENYYYCWVEDKKWETGYTAKLVENNPEWFELVLPVSEKVKVGKMRCVEGNSLSNLGEMKWVLQFKTNKHIHYDNAVKLCNVLESALNNDTVVEDIRDNKIYLLEEDLKCIHSYLDALQVERKDDKGENYSINGRITLLKLKYKKELSQLETEYLKLLTPPEQPTDDNAFVWTDELLHKFINSIGDEWEFSLLKGEIDFFKQSKQSEPLPSDTVSKEWEIVSFKTGDGGIALKMDNSDFGLSWQVQSGYSKGKISYETCLEKFSIHSVKRLSDNEVFTIGDKVSWGCTGVYETKITGFEIKDGGLKFYDERLPENRNPCSFLGAVNLHKLPPKKKEVVTDNTDVQVPISFNEILQAVGQRIRHYDQEQLKKLIAEKLKQ